MARNPLWFDQSRVTVIIDGKPVIGLFSGDSVRITPNTEGSSMDVGLSGATTTFSNDQSGQLEIDLKGTSLSLEIFNRLWKAQTSGAARLFSGLIITAAIEPVQLEGMSIASIGSISTGGKQATARTLVFNVQKIKFQ